MASGAQPATDTSLTGISPDRKRSHEPQTHLITQAIHAGTRAPVPPKPIGPFSAVSSSSTEGPVVNNTSSIHRTPSKSSISEAQHMSTVLVPTAMQGVLHSNLKHIGMPRAIGALRNRSPALLRHLTTPNVARSTLGLNLNKVPSPVFSVKTESDSNCEDSDNESTHTIDTQARSSEEHKAQLVLNATRAQRDVCFAEKTLADCVVQQNRALGLLYQFEATEAGRKLEDAHIDIGYVRHSVHKIGITLLEDFTSSKPRKRRRKSTSQVDGDTLSPEVDLALPLPGPLADTGSASATQS
ncbi:uncharacterized protein HD556DRAFT_1446141 [Suillus plorans]|uniref:Uncharacterized protein n=1 Tax=Suillus plorans TaxID=116603 RepID=A0A9P7AKQ4_9AGAM|nr:uncharacterized protein HD556DRAFT_1446141 [Suillus plorans]KAG1790412.1 hypothetical protein HD556DRAFT_1446141 [Suillus plorans]